MLKKINKPVINIPDIVRRFLRSTQLDISRKYLLEVNNEGNLRICGITDVNSFEDDNILVSSDEIITEIKGENMFFKTFSDKEIFVFGKINTINFIRR